MEESPDNKNDSFTLSFQEYNILLFLPKSKWIPDEKVDNCFNCNKRFMYLLRRKHHCRKCGFIFCDNCSKNFLNIEELGINYNEKLVRLCDYCFQGCQNYLKLIEKEAKGSLINNNDQVSNDVGIQDEEEFSENTITYSNNIQDNELSLDLKNISLTKIEETVSFFLKKLNFYDLYFEKLNPIIIEVITNTKLDYVNGKDNMDINYYIKIKKIVFPDISETKFIKGVVITKNVSDRKMKKYLENPKIMIVSPSIDLITSNNDFESELTNFENLIQTEKKTMKKISENIINLNPDLIFVEKNVNRFAFDYLRNNDITLIVKLKPHLIKRLSRATKAKIIKNVKYLNKIIDPEKILGQCGKMYIKKYDILETNQSKDPTLLYLDEIQTNNIGTITLSGPEIKDLEILKKYLKIMLILSRHYFLEKEIVFIDKKFVDELEAKKINSNKTEGDFSDFLDNKISLKKFIKKEFINYSKIKLVRTIIENHIDLTTNIIAVEEIVTKYEQDPQNKLNFLADMCGPPSLKSIYYYSNDDIGIGTFIIKKVKNLFTRCETCKRPRYHHIDFYCQSDVYVKITVELTGFSKTLAINGDGLLLDGRRSLDMDRYSSENIELRQSLSNKNDNMILSKKKRVASQLESHFSYIIKTYISCKICGTKLTQEINLEKEYLQYSFTRILSHFFLNKFDEEKNNYKEVENPQDSICQHKIKKRVFQYGEYLVNFISGKLNKFNLNLLKPNSKYHLETLIISSNKLLEEKKNLYLLKFKNLIINLINFLKKIIAEQHLENSEKECLNYLESLLKVFGNFAITVESSFKIVFSNYLEIENKKFELSQSFTKYLDIVSEINKKIAEKDYNSIKTFLISFLNNCEMKKADSFVKNRPIKSITTSLSRSALTKNKKDIEVNYQYEKDENYFSPYLRQSFPIKKALKRSVSNLKKEEFFTGNKNNNFSHFKLNDNLMTQNRLSSISTNNIQGMDKVLIFNQHFSPEKSPRETTENCDSLSEKDDCAKYDENNEINDFAFEIHEDIDEIENNTEINENSKDNIKKSEVKYSIKFEEEFNELYYLNSGQILNQKIDEEMINLKKYKYLPIYINEPITAIAGALNSADYLKNVYFKGEFHHYEQEINLLNCSKQYKETIRPLVKSHLKLSKNTKFNHFIFRTHVIKQYLTNLELKKNIEKPTDSLVSEKLDITNINKKKIIPLKVIVYFPEQFEALRIENKILLESFIKSIGSSFHWQDNTGGKSKAKFMKSYDELYIFKEMDKKEFLMFFNYASSYFDYMWKISVKKKPSFLSKIYGMFQIKIDGEETFYIAMDNLFFGIDMNNEIQIYDLKGSETNRFAIPNSKKTQTLLDTNFKLDQNGEPLALKSIDKKYCNYAFQLDSNFLKKHKIIDYSLLLILDRTNNSIRMGIIDYLREFTWDKKVESIAKTFTKGTTPTIVNAEDYQKRFLDAMDKYFMEISTE